MPNTEILERSVPIAPLKIVALRGCSDLASKVDRHLVSYRHELEEHKSRAGHGIVSPLGFCEDSFLVECECPRFGTGEAKGVLKDSVRGADLYIMVDVMNYSETYTLFGKENHMSPDNHYQDLKRIISAAHGKAQRINVIMPFLYSSRQHKRTQRESLDCAMALKELSNMGVSNIITFDAHDPSVQNSIPLKGFDNFFCSYQFLKALIDSVKDLQLDKEHLAVISPDEGAMSRSSYIAELLGVDLGVFYKRRDYSTIVDGKNPVIAHEYLGDSIAGKDCIIMDDMIATGGSILDTCRKLKVEYGARRTFVMSTFGLFCDGFGKFDEFYNDHMLDKVITTNLNYRPEECFAKKYYAEADMSKYIASIIDTLNHNVPISKVRKDDEKILELLEEYRQSHRRTE